MVLSEAYFKIIPGWSIFSISAILTRLVAFN